MITINIIISICGRTKKMKANISITKKNMSRAVFRSLDYTISPALYLGVTGSNTDPRSLEDPERLRREWNLPRPYGAEIRYNWNSFLHKFYQFNAELMRNNIYSQSFPLGFTNSVASSVAEKAACNKSFIYFTQQAADFAMREGALILYHEILSDDHYLVIELLEKYFHKRFKWNGTAPAAIELRLPLLRGDE